MEKLLCDADFEADDGTISGCFSLSQPLEIFLAFLLCGGPILLACLSYNMTMVLLVSNNAL